MKKVLILSSPESQFCRSIVDVINVLGEVVYKSEHDFSRVTMLIDFVKEHKITEVLMPNPYGNNKRKTCYNKLKENNIKVVTSDRGALPNSWFFDQGFNYDSDSYKPESWNKSLTKENRADVRKYIEELRVGKAALEKQGNRIGGKKLREKLGIDQDTKVIFVPLQRPNDTVIKFFAGFAENIPNFITQIEKIAERLSESNSSKYVFLLKKHPLEVEYFSFQSAENIGYVSDDTNFYDLIELSDMVMLINSGVGLNALAYMKPVLAFGDAFYAHEGLATSIYNIDQAVEFIKDPKKPNQTSVAKFIYHLVTNVYSFAEFKTELVKQKDGSFRNETKKIIFENIKWNGEKIKIFKKRILVVSPLIPFPIYRGNQARIDTFIRWLIEHDFSVDLVVLNTSFDSEKSFDIKQQLTKAYKGVNSIEVFKDPKLEKKYQLKLFKHKVKKINLKDLLKQKSLVGTYQKLANDFMMDSKVAKSLLHHEYINIKDKFSGKVHDVVNEEKIPQKFIQAVQNKILSNDYDYILLNYAKTIPCIDNCDTKARVILDTHDYQSMFLEEDQVFNNKNTHINLERFRKNEHFLMNMADTIIAINKNEEDIFKNLLPEKDVLTIPAFFPKPESGPKFWGYNAHALYVGSISNFNVNGLIWFLENVLPVVKKDIPDFQLAIAGNVGKSKEIDWEKYKDNINVLGRVDNLTHCYSNSCIVIAPILGGAGMKIKVVEALSHKKAIVGTPKAFDGIFYSENMSMNITDDPEAFAKSLILLVKDESVRKHSELESQRLYEKYHSLEALDYSLLSIFD